MSWREITMKFPGTCIVCNEKIDVGQTVLWAKGAGVKCQKCSEVKELQCLVCGGPAGCMHCEFQDGCDIANVSQFCICKGCSENKDAFESYQKATARKFPITNS